MERYREGGGPPGIENITIQHAKTEGARGQSQRLVYESRTLHGAGGKKEKRGTSGAAGKFLVERSQKRKESGQAKSN